jgi:hemoglobin
VNPSPPPPTLFDVVGGTSFFEELVDRFYGGIEGDEVLRPLYPEDLGPPRRHLALFLAQYWGGPAAYDAERGEPRLRMRHVPFPIGTDARDRWLGHMRAAVAALDPPPAVAAALLEYFEMAAEALRNRDGG